MFYVYVYIYINIYTRTHTKGAAFLSVIGSFLVSNHAHTITNKQTKTNKQTSNIFKAIFYCAVCFVYIPVWQTTGASLEYNDNNKCDGINDWSATEEFCTRVPGVHGPRRGVTRTELPAGTLPAVRPGTRTAVPRCYASGRQMARRTQYGHNPIK